MHGRTVISVLVYFTGINKRQNISSLEMIAEENILKFLEGFNKDSRIDSRVLEMLTSGPSCECDVLGMAEDLIKSSVNVKNLRFVLDRHKEQDVEGAAAFDGANNIRDRFSLFSTGGSSHNGAVGCSVSKKFADRPDEHLSEEMTKRPKISELQGNVNKYSEGDMDDVVDSLKNSPRGCFIPGLESTISEGDSNDRLLHGPCESEDTPQRNRSERHQTPGTPRSRSSRSVDHIHRNAFDQNVSSGRGNATRHGADHSTGKDSVFSQNVLPGGSIVPHKLRDPSYLYPVLQCKLCGLRFTRNSTEQFGLHIEDHRRKTKALGDKMVLRREFFSSKSVSRMEKLDLEIEGNVELIVWKKESPHCVICGKIIKKAWSDDAENWILVDGTQVNNREFAHRDCVL